MADFQEQNLPTDNASTHRLLQIYDPSQIDNRIVECDIQFLE